MLKQEERDVFDLTDFYHFIRDNEKNLGITQYGKVLITNYRCLMELHRENQSLETITIDLYLVGPNRDVIDIYFGESVSTTKLIISAPICQISKDNLKPFKDILKMYINITETTL